MLFPALAPLAAGAVILSDRDRRYLPAAAALTALLGVNLVRELPLPVRLDVALVVVWPGIVAAPVVAVVGRRSPWRVPGFYAVFAAVVALLYCRPLAMLYEPALWTSRAIATSVLPWAWWARRGAGVRGWWSAPEVVALLPLVTLSAGLGGAWLFAWLPYPGGVWRDWPLATLATLICYVGEGIALAVAAVGMAIRRPDKARPRRT